MGQISLIENAITDEELEYNETAKKLIDANRQYTRLSNAREELSRIHSGKGSQLGLTYLNANIEYSNPDIKKYIDDYSEKYFEARKTWEGKLERKVRRNVYNPLIESYYIEISDECENLIIEYDHAIYRYENNIIPNLKDELDKLKKVLGLD